MRYDEDEDDGQAFLPRSEMEAALALALDEISSPGGLIDEANAACDSLSEGFAKRGHNTAQRRVVQQHMEAEKHGGSGQGKVAATAAVAGPSAAPVMVAVGPRVRALLAALAEIPDEVAVAVAVPELSPSECRVVNVFPSVKGSGSSGGGGGGHGSSSASGGHGSAALAALGALAERDRNQVLAYGVPADRNRIEGIADRLGRAAATGHWTMMERLSLRVAAWLKHIDPRQHNDHHHRQPQPQQPQQPQQPTSPAAAEATEAASATAAFSPSSSAAAAARRPHRTGPLQSDSDEGPLRFLRGRPLPGLRSRARAAALAEVNSALVDVWLPADLDECARHEAASARGRDVEEKKRKGTVFAVFTSPGLGGGSVTLADAAGSGAGSGVGSGAGSGQGGPSAAAAGIESLGLKMGIVLEYDGGIGACFVRNFLPYRKPAPLSAARTAAAAAVKELSKNAPGPPPPPPEGRELAAAAAGSASADRSIAQGGASNASSMERGASQGRAALFGNSNCGGKGGNFSRMAPAFSIGTGVGLPAQDSATPWSHLPAGEKPAVNGSSVGSWPILHGRVRRGAVLAAVDMEVLVGVPYDRIVQVLSSARTDGAPHAVIFMHGPVAWLRHTSDFESTDPAGSQPNDQGRGQQHTTSNNSGSSSSSSNDGTVSSNRHLEAVLTAGAKAAVAHHALALANTRGALLPPTDGSGNRDPFSPSSSRNAAARGDGGERVFLRPRASLNRFRQLRQEAPAMPLGSAL